MKTRPAVTMMFALGMALATPARAAGRREVLRVESDAADGTATFKDASPEAHAVKREGNTHHSAKHRRRGRSSGFPFAFGDLEAALADLLVEKAPS